MTTQTDVSTELAARQQTIAGLRQLADFLEAHPDVPVAEHGQTFLVFAEGPTDRAACGEVDRLAVVMDVQVDDDTADGGHYSATRSFGLIAYRAVHIPSRARDEHQARVSYCRNVVVSSSPQNGDEPGRLAKTTADINEGDRP